MPDNTAEEWREIPGFPGYEASSLGRIRSSRRKGMLHVLRANVGKNGYPSLTLRTPSGPTVHCVHSLVLLTFVGPRPDGLVSRHLNDDKRDNRLENLAYGTYSENMEDAIRNGRRVYTHCRNGHELTPDNTLVQRSKDRMRRRCATCNRVAQRRYLERKSLRGTDRRVEEIPWELRGVFEE